MQLRLAAMERVHLLEVERSRIARDIHDELGANSAAIALMSGRTRDQLPDHPKAAAQVEEISRRATKTARQLAEYCLGRKSRPRFNRTSGRIYLPICPGISRAGECAFSGRNPAESPLWRCPPAQDIRFF